MSKKYKIRSMLICCLFIVIGFSVHAQTYDTTYYKGNWDKIEYNKDSVEFYGVGWENEDLNLYEVMDYFVSGQLQMHAFYKSSDQKVKVGDCIWYHENGQKSLEGFYEEGKKQGVFIRHNEKGELVYEEEYKRGELNFGTSYKDGKKYSYKILEAMPYIKECKKKNEKDRIECTNLKIQEHISTIEYPKKALDEDIEGRVFIAFVIDPKGKVTKVSSRKIVNEILEKAGIEHISSMEKWIPGIQRGINVPVQYIVPINFKINYEDD